MVGAALKRIAVFWRAHLIASKESLVQRNTAAQVLILSLAVAACSGKSVKPHGDSAPTTAVAAREVSSTDHGSYSASASVSFNRPFPDPENTLPIFPVALVDQTEEPITLVVDVIVDSNGRVERVDLVEQPGKSVSSKFFDSVVAAVRTWHFTPLIRTELKFDADDSESNSRQYVSESLPFTQRYEFRFSLVDGRPSVTSN